MTHKIKIAIIGVGRWGVHLLRNFLSHPNAQVVAVVDPTAQRLMAVKEQFNLNDNTNNNILFTRDFLSLRQIPDLAAVVIATPATTHYQLISQALNNGYHVLAEKPLTVDPKECLELCQLAEKLQLQLMVDHTYLFHPAVERGQRVIAEKQLGQLRYGYGTRTHLGPVRQDVDALWDLAIHDIAIFNNWLQQKPIQVQAKGTVWLQNGNITEANLQPTSNNLLLPVPKLSDLIWLTLTYPDGFTACIHLCWLNPDKQRRLAIVGSLGSLIFDEMSTNAPLTFVHGEFEQQGHLFIPVNQSQEVISIEASEPLKKVCDKFIFSILSNTASHLSSGWVGAELVEILTALTQSLNQGGIPIFL
jgi:predicted dehydrogenase